MKNKEKFAKEILELAINRKSFAVVKGTNKIRSCIGLPCNLCIFSGGTVIDCAESKKQWAEAEYVERKVFTEEEKAILRALPKVNWVAKHANNEVCAYTDKPHKNESDKCWAISNGIYASLSRLCNCKFASIKWEDTEPTSREEILR